MNKKDCFINELYILATQDKSEETTDLIFQFLDDLLINEEFKLVDDILCEIHIAKITRQMQRSILAITAPAKDKLPNRSDFYEVCYFKSLLEYGPENTKRILGALE